MSTNCDIIRDLLPLYVDGTLSEASAELVREHLRECHPCRLNYRQLKPIIKNAVSPSLGSHAEYGDFLRRVRSRPHDPSGRYHRNRHNLSHADRGRHG